MTKIHFHKVRIFVPLIAFNLCLLIYYFYIFMPQWKADVRERVILQMSMEKHVKEGSSIYKNRESHLACIQPIKNFSAKNFITTKDVLVCQEGKNWVTVDGSEAIISSSIKKEKGAINCSFTELLRLNDDSTEEGRTSTSIDDRFVFTTSDFYVVSCVAKNGDRWDSTLVGIRRDLNVQLEKGWDLVPEHSVKLNVLMLGFDSLSHISFIQNLPKTYRFLNEVLGSNIMDGYNIVGDGTPQALIPMLTGKTELELPEARKRMGLSAQYVNIYPFIWNNFSQNGYVTLFAEDQPTEGCFNYRLKGFDATPTHHYMRPFFLYMYPKYSQHPNYCLYSSPRHKIFLKYLTDFFDVYADKPKFGFGMHTELSHGDSNLISIADEDIHDSLSSLRDKGHLNDTILILFSDHGNRFSAGRATLQGKQEERLPFVSIYLPPKFKELYPSAADNVRVNTKRLTSPFDIYPTLRDLTDFSGAKLGKVTDRGISLFSEIPPSRTCSDAFIEPHWCACLLWEPIATTDDIAIEASKALVHYINTYTVPQRSLCHELELHWISWVALLVPNKGLVSFKQTLDYDGFLPDFSDKTAISEQVYQVGIKAVPTKEYFHTSNDVPMFEASLTYNIKQDSFSLKIDDVSRINKYGDQPHCIMSTHPHLRKFCYCNQPP